MRDPLERYMSHYNHDKGTKWAKDFDHFLSRTYIKNFMVNKIAGEGSNDLEKAKQLLDQYSFVGDTNRYSQSLNHLSKLMGKQFYGLKHSKNVRKSNEDYLKFEDLSEDKKRQVLKQNELDIKLYDYFLSRSSFLDEYPSSYDFKKPSVLRIKVLDKINRIKKKKMTDIRKNIK